MKKNRLFKTFLFLFMSSSLISCSKVDLSNASQVSKPTITL